MAFFSEGIIYALRSIGERMEEKFKTIEESGVKQHGR